MFEKLRKLQENSYVPLTNYRTASIVVTKDGKGFPGVNVENPSFRDGMCAEQNAILEAGKSRCDMRGSTMYCSLTPCSACAKLIINAGIVRIVCLDNYPDKFSLKLLKEAGVVVEYYT